MNSENRGMDGLPDQQFKDTRLEIMELLNNIVLEGGLKFQSEHLLKTMVDATVTQIGWIWYGDNPVKDSDE